MLCRLLGVIANKPVDLAFSLGKFRSRALWNPDGWGIGWYEAGKPMVFKRPISAERDALYSEKSQQVTSRVIMAHVRKATTGEATARNTHPFSFDHWIFAHNGSVDRNKVYSMLRGRYREDIGGETDSEVFFRFILQCIDDEGDPVGGIVRAVREIVDAGADDSGLNFLMSDGEDLYAFRYSRERKDYYSLFRLVRKGGKRGPFKAISQETWTLLLSKALEGEEAVLICSEKLTDDEPWEEVHLGTLVAVDRNLRITERKIL